MRLPQEQDSGFPLFVDPRLPVGHVSSISTSLPSLGTPPIGLMNELPTFQFSIHGAPWVTCGFLFFFSTLDNHPPAPPSVWPGHAALKNEVHTFYFSLTHGIQWVTCNTAPFPGRLKSFSALSTHILTIFLIDRIPLQSCTGIDCRVLTASLPPRSSVELQSVCFR